MSRYLYKHRGSSFVEYGLVLGLASLALIGMNTYIKRGLQGKVKGLADYFIGQQQIGEISPTAISNSKSSNKVKAAVDYSLFRGGETGVASSERVETESESKVIDSQDQLFNPDFINSKEGDSPSPDILLGGQGNVTQ